MKISVTLTRVKRLYVESAPLIYYVEENPNYVERMDTIIATVESAQIEAVSSVITLTEVLTHPFRQEQTRFEQEYRDILLHSDGFRLVLVNAEIAEAAARLRARYNLRTPDALHTATAIQAGCDAFLTNDLSIKRVTELHVLVLDELELDTPPKMP